jgi:hypothetical protein
VTIAGTTPERGLRVALDLEAGPVGACARYRGFAYLPDAELTVVLDVDVASGDVRVTYGASAAAGETPLALARTESSFIEQLGKQAFRLATVTPAQDGGGRWPRRIHRWRGPK